MAGMEKMQSKTKFELFRWFHLVSIFLVSVALSMLIIELLALPMLRWLLCGIHYHFPTLNRVRQIGLFTLISSLFAGTVAWFYEKKVSGR